MAAKPMRENRRTRSRRRSRRRRRRSRRRRRRSERVKWPLRLIWSQGYHLMTKN